jgi:hypothetical protein
MGRGSGYLRALLRHLGAIPPDPGKVGHLEIRHDPECERPDGGPCTCEPEIASGPLVDRKHGGTP